MATHMAFGVENGGINHSDSRKRDHQCADACRQAAGRCQALPPAPASAGALTAVAAAVSAAPGLLAAQQAPRRGLAAEAGALLDCRRPCMPQCGLGAAAAQQAAAAQRWGCHRWQRLPGCAGPPGAQNGDALLTSAGKRNLIPQQCTVVQVGCGRFGRTQVTHSGAQDASRCRGGRRAELVDTGLRTRNHESYTGLSSD